jgi:hypothetical protein
MAEKFFFETFTNLMTISPKRAMEYRDRCHLTTIEKVEEKTTEIKEEKTTEIKTSDEIKEDIN